MVELTCLLGAVADEPFFAYAATVGEELSFFLACIVDVVLQVRVSRVNGSV